MSSTNSEPGNTESEHASGTLEPYGLAALAPARRAALEALGIPGRVVAAHRSRWQVVTPAGERSCVLAGHFRAAPAVDRPVAGDWVALREPAHGTHVIAAVAPRTSLLRRVAPGGRDGDQPVAANVDTVLVVSGLDGDHNPRRLRRYLALARGGGARPVILLNKADLAANPAAAIASLSGIDPDVPVHLVSALRNDGLAALDAYLAPGHTLILLGSSGVGKSTIINRLLGDARQATAAVREDDSRGRHTTTRRELFPHASGAVIVDTPGMRELALSAESSDLSAGFADLVALAAKCRFNDCTHASEPGCAVRDAITNGTLPQALLAEYRKLERETLRDAELKHERNAREKKFGRVVRDALRRKGRK